MYLYKSQWHIAVSNEMTMDQYVECYTPALVWKW
jgi:hypothetical protein